MSQLDLCVPDYPTGARKIDQYFEILRKYLEPWTSMTLEQAAKSILKMLPEDVSPSGPGYTFGEVCVDVAENIPYYHTSHVKLVELLAFIARTDIACEEMKMTTVKAKKYLPLPQFGGSMLDNLTGKQRGSEYLLLKSNSRCSAYTVISPDPDEESPLTYVNFQAFAANLLAYHVYPIDPTWTIWAHRDALEGGSTAVGVVKEALIMGAAQYILHSGQTLFKYMLVTCELLASQDKSWEPGPLYKGKPAFSLHRWRFWRDAYEAVSKTDNISEKGRHNQECRDIAGRAAKLMESLEESLKLK